MWEGTSVLGVPFVFMLKYRACGMQKTAEAIACLRESARLVSSTLGALSGHIREGVTPLFLDRIAETYIRDHGAQPAFLHLYGFPNTLCVSVNEAVVHGIPTERPLRNGDVVSVDCGVLKNGYFGDQAYTFPVGEVSPDTLSLLSATYQALLSGVSAFRAGNRLGDVGHAIQSLVEGRGYNVVRELVGHGIGKSLHEPPNVPNYGVRGRGKSIKEGMTVALEPMVNRGTHAIKRSDDGWTIYTADGACSAHYEHNVAVVNGAPELLTTFDYIDDSFHRRISQE